MAVTHKPSTRDRILQVALAAFNARGIHRVTTAEIAEAAQINEGNLYYYFQRKEHLAEALFDIFEAALIGVADRPVADPTDPACYAAYQRGWFALMWDYRVFYRDGMALRSLAPALRERLGDVTRLGQEAVRRVFGLMTAHGLMRASTEEIDALIGNIWIVSSYWMDFRMMGQGAAEIVEADLVWGFRQVEMLYRPYLTVAGRLLADIQDYENASLVSEVVEK